MTMCAFAQVDTTQRRDSAQVVPDSAMIRVNDSTGKFVPVDSAINMAAPISYNSKIDSVLKHHSPRKAAIRSALVPGLGQVYNKKYWKNPIIYGALGISASIFVYNLKWYRRTRFAYTAKYEAIQILSGSEFSNIPVPGPKMPTVAVPGPARIGLNFIIIAAHPSS